MSAAAVPTPRQLFQARLTPPCACARAAPNVSRAMETSRTFFMSSLRGGRTRPPKNQSVSTLSLAMRRAEGVGQREHPVTNAQPFLGQYRDYCPSFGGRARPRKANRAPRASEIRSPAPVPVFIGKPGPALETPSGARGGAVGMCSDA